MADIAIWKKILDQAEGRTWDATDVGVGDGTHYGVSAGSLKTATGKTVSQAWLKNAKYEDPLIQATIDWHWQKAKVGDLPQDIANSIADFLFNKGMGRARVIQNMLITRYGADIKDDGVIGNQTIGALKDAIAKHGETEVYNAIYAWRYGFYTGAKLPNKSGHKNGNSDAKYYALANSRLNRYYPSKGGAVNFADFLKPIDGSSIATDGNQTGESLEDILKKPQSKTDRTKTILLAVFGIGAIGALVYFIVSYFNKRGMAVANGQQPKVTTVFHVSKPK